MIDKRLFDAEVRRFIKNNVGADLVKLALTKLPFADIERQEILNQIAGKSKAKEKLPTWFQNDHVIYPSKISLEQSSSEATAKFKASLIAGDSLIDLTGGFGVDDYFFSKQVETVVHCELDATLSEIVSHNCGALGAENIRCIHGDSINILESLPNQWSWIYIDPSRRNDSIGKVFMLKDCLPDVPSNLDRYFAKSDRIMIKTSPLLDLSAGLSELYGVFEIYVVAVRNEVKELLWILKKGYGEMPMIKTVNIGNGRMESFECEFGNQPGATFGHPEKYLYEPNAAIMKAGLFDAVSERFEVNKLHAHSHLYTSDKLTEFPGRTFSIEKVIKYNKASFSELSKIGKANVTVRNFPESVDTIRKKLKIKDGGDVFCFFTTDVNDDKIVLLCAKI